MAVLFTYASVLLWDGVAKNIVIPNRHEINIRIDMSGGKGYLLGTVQENKV